jgi:diazepam-binding inhibitor (GABA receptor modulator, acyl-CoA-binding protein)
MASNTELRFPQDIMLHFYAYYKRATQRNGFYSPGNEEDIRNGFKANALLQVKDLTKEEAKEKYIEMVEKHIGEV